MITIIWAILRSIPLLIGATFLMFQISTCASVVSMKPAAYLVVEKSVDKLNDVEAQESGRKLVFSTSPTVYLLVEESIDNPKLKKRIRERVERFNKDGLPDDRLFQLSIDIFHLQIAHPGSWNRLRWELLPDNVKRRIRRDPEYRKKVGLSSPLTYLSAIHAPEAFEDLELVKGTVHFYKGDTNGAIDSYRKAIDSENPLALINLSSLLVSQRNDLFFVIDRLKRELTKGHNDAFIIDLLSLRLGEAYVAKRKFGRGVPYLKDAVSSRHREVASPAQLRLAALRARGLDVTYFGWVKRVFKGDLGKSVSSGKKVAPQLKSRFLLTLRLALVTTLLAFGIALPLGILLGTYPDLKLTHIKSFIYLLSGLPVFLVGYLCLRWFHPREGSFAYYLIAGLCLAFGNGLIYQMVQRIQGETQRLLSSDFFLAVQARRASTQKHLIKNLVWPAVSTFVSQVPLLLSGAIVVEVIFNYQGVGYWLFSAVKAKDFPVVLPACATLVFMVFVVNILRDFVQYLVDPQLRG